MAKPFNVGDHVRLRSDPRHYGIGEAFIDTHVVVREKWPEITWITDEKPDNLEWVYPAELERGNGRST